MAEFKNHKPVGGMIANPFGGHGRLDKIEQDDLAGSTTQAEEMIYRAVILDAVQSYLFFGLGHNGTVAQEFMWVYDYFFAVESTDTESWNSDRQIKISDGGIGNPHVFADLDDEAMAGMCFDSQYALSELDRSMNVAWFCRLLKAKRRNIIAANLEQVRDYVRTLRQQAAERGEFMRPGCHQGGSSGDSGYADR